MRMGVTAYVRDHTCTQVHTHVDTHRACTKHASRTNLRHVSDAFPQLPVEVVRVIELLDRRQMELESLHVALMMLDLL